MKFCKKIEVLLVFLGGFCGSRRIYKEKNNENVVSDREKIVYE
jgi:hypothetical protein